MTARQFLELYGDADRKAKLYQEEYEIECLKIDAIGSVMGGDGLPHGTGIKKTTEDKAIRLADKAAAWKIAELDALEIRQKVFETIMLVGGLESEVLVERYINLLPWAEVCKAVGYSWFMVRKAWHNGEEKINNILQTTINIDDIIL